MVRLLLQSVSFLEPFLCVVALSLLVRSKQAKQYLALTIFLAVRLSLDVSETILLHLVNQNSSISDFAYTLYFYTYWIGSAAESLASLYIILGIFRQALAPLKGLRNLGMLIFRWAAGVSIVLAFVIGFRPSASGTQLITSIVHQFSQISGVFVLALLVFVCFAIRPMGLTLRSRQFGVSVGLGVASCCRLAHVAWLPDAQLYSIANVFFCYADFFTIALWAAYFYLPEVTPRILMLPTTSPYLLWNEISEALGDEPGYVAIGGISSDIFAAAEMEFMVRASAAINEAEKTKALQPAEPRALSA